MQRTLALLLNFLFMSVFIAYAQQVKPRLTDLPLSSLDAFVKPSSNWKIVGNVQAKYWDTILNTATGDQILFNDFSRSIQFNSGTNLFSKLEHGDIVLEMDFMIPKGSNSGIYMQSRYEVQIADSWGILLPKHSDMGGIYERWKEGKGFEGKAPMKNAGFAPGLWNHLEISFQAPRFNASGKKTSPAKFVYVKLNGIILHENIIVTGPTRAAAFENETDKAPFMIQGDHGQIAFKNIRYAPQEELNVTLTDLSYMYFEKIIKNPIEAKNSKPNATGPATAIDARLAAARDKYFLSFEGKLTVPSTDTYTFTLRHSGDASLEVDGKPVIDPTWNHLGGYPTIGKTEITTGTHQLKLWVSKDLNWSSSGIALSIEKPNSKAVALNSPASIPERVPDPLIMVRADRQTELIRSFLYHNDKKLTHVLSVGDPTNVHYSYDLLQGGLLQAWKGDFLNTTDMWYERGEPQTASALGAAIIFPGKCPIHNFSLSIDSVDNYKYNGYTLNNSGAPTFYYKYRNLEIADSIRPYENGKGLERTISVKGNDTDGTMLRIAQSKNIESMGNGIYRLGNGQYYIQIDNDAAAVINSYKDDQVLLVPSKGKTTYSIIW